MSAPTISTPSSTLSDSDKVGMSDSVPTTRPHLHLRHPLSRKLRVAHDLGISPAQADKWLYGERAINVLNAAIIESDMRAGDHEAVAAWVAPADAAMLATSIPHLMEAFADYDEADVDEDAAQCALNRMCYEKMNDADLETYRRAVAKEVFAGTRCIAAIREVQKNRKAAAR
jgi:hypothetical protein